MIQEDSQGLCESDCLRVCTTHHGKRCFGNFPNTPKEFHYEDGNTDGGLLIIPFKFDPRWNHPWENYLCSINSAE